MKGGWIISNRLLSFVLSLSCRVEYPVQIVKLLDSQLLVSDKLFNRQKKIGADSILWIQPFVVI